jgi:hypothetical protein
MQSIKTKIAIVVGIGLIVFVASMLGLPFINSDLSVQKISHDNIKKLDESEKKILDFTAQEKTELESKISGKIKIP